jgi:subtilase family protein
MTSPSRRAAAAVGAALLAILLVVAGGQAAPKPSGKPVAVKTASDVAKAKLHPRLVEKLESGSTDRIPVFLTVTGDRDQAMRLLKNAYAAEMGDSALVVGSIPVQSLPKLASASGIGMVGPIEFEQTGQPLGGKEPNQTPSTAALKSFMNNLTRQEVPYSEAPAPKESRFEQVKNIELLDAKTHTFAKAWQAGFDGTGSTVAVLDGGTDFGHPDLLQNTWAVDASGWPRAYDPFGTLQWLQAPGQIDAGLSWYVKTEASSSFTQNDQDLKHSLYRVTFANKTGPSRNFSAPTGTNTHAYTFPKAWTKSGTVRLGNHPDDHLLQLFGERAAFIVVDPNTAGVYDTVYVDLDHDFQFADEKPVTKASPVSYRDMNGDGYTDLSGGLLYYISDGKGAAGRAVPGGLERFGLTIKGDPGEILAWSGDFDPAIGGHGTQTASNVVGQGVATGKAPQFADVPTYPGVIGGAPKAKLAPFGDIYFSFDFSTQFAHLLNQHPASRVDVSTNSYGSSAVDNDGYDAASQEMIRWATRTVGGVRGTSTALFSTGNGAPGFGTESPPSPYTALSVGASTQFGGTGWDSIKFASQIVDNDVMVWSNRGPGAMGSNAVDLVADGAFSTGDITLNTILDGRTAWLTWGGTSRSAPVAGGAAALVYQAWRASHGGTIPNDFLFKAQEIMKSSAQDLGYESWIQGSGSLDAKRATEIAMSGGAVSPDEWRPGAYRGTEYPSFAHTIAPGGSDSQTFTVDGGGPYTVSDRYVKRSATVSRNFTTAPVNKETKAWNFDAPDYLVNISDIVAAHPNADLMVVRANFDYAKFDGNQDYVADQAWRLLTYNWTDVNRDGDLWSDSDSDGAVDYIVTAHHSQIDAGAERNDINYGASEIDEGEYVRFMYHRPGANTLQSWVRTPAQRKADGIFLGFQHSARNGAIPQTDFRIQFDFYENVDWPWVTTTPVSGGAFSATINVPEGTPFGQYNGAIVLTGGGRNVVVPVAVNVAAQVPQNESGKITGNLTFGGDAVAEAQKDLLYNNGSVFGATDWTWRAESGDWRFFYADIANAPPPGTLLLTDTSWAGPAPFTDLDTIIFGPSANTYQLTGGSAPFGAPYILDTVGKSPNTRTGAGVWRFNTATGGPQELVAAPARSGLHAVLQHQVNFNGDKFDVPFKTTLGAASVTPANVNVATGSDTGSFDVTFEATVPLAGLTAEAFGLSQPTTENVQVKQDDPDDPSSASVKRNFTVSHASRLAVKFDMSTDDVDLFVVHDANNDGQFTNSEIVGASTTATAHEHVELIRPADGNYQIWAQGWSVAGTPTGVLSIDPIQGNDMTVSGIPAGAIPAGTPVTIHVDFSKSMTAGQSYFGELLLGPPTAPTAVKVPIKVTRS